MEWIDMDFLEFSCLLSKKRRTRKVDYQIRNKYLQIFLDANDCEEPLRKYIHNKLSELIKQYNFK